MADDAHLTAFETWAGEHLAKLEPAARRKLAREIATALRRSQQARIAAQRNPDGTAYEPRAKRGRARDKAGRIKRQRAMFAKLRTARFMRVRATDAAAVVEFTGRAARIARVHQAGQQDTVSERGPRVRYPRRELLGFTAADQELVRDLLVHHLS